MDRRFRRTISAVRIAALISTAAWIQGTTAEEVAIPEEVLNNFLRRSGVETKTARQAPVPWSAEEEESVGEEEGKAEDGEEDDDVSSISSATTDVDGVSSVSSVEEDGEEAIEEGSGAGLPSSPPVTSGAEVEGDPTGLASIDPRPELSQAATAGIILFCIVAVLAIVGLVSFTRRRRKARRLREDPEESSADQPMAMQGAAPSVIEPVHLRPEWQVRPPSPEPNGQWLPVPPWQEDPPTWREPRPWRQSSQPSVAPPVGLPANPSPRPKGLGYTFVIQIQSSIKLLISSGINVDAKDIRWRSHTVLEGLGTALNAGQLTSDVAAATCISTTIVLASTGGVWPPRTRDWYCAGSSTWSGMCAVQTTSVLTDDSNTMTTTRPVDREPETDRCVVEGVEMPSPQGSSSGSGLGTTTPPFSGYNLKPTTTCEVKDVETPPGDSTTTSSSTSTSTSTSRRMLIAVPVTTDSATPTPIPSRHTPPTSPAVTRNNDDSEPVEIKTCGIRDVETPPAESTTSAGTSTVPLREGASTSHQFATTDPVTTAALTLADNRIPPKTTPIASDSSSSATDEAACGVRDAKTVPEDSGTTSPASSTRLDETGVFLKPVFSGSPMAGVLTEGRR
ncbi:hypothetical protein DL764_008216 [Monosporascus ibericus]|uniref:Uncharacterized protein n=1 Tax=Monosporascus ibericus TaxID=155417 RepID=A0A4Q4SY25_9PEZI|nr:hypothetical protein DL764_008216 [Monosporascus ibericus]